MKTKIYFSKTTKGVRNFTVCLLTFALLFASAGLFAQHNDGQITSTSDGKYYIVSSQNSDQVNFTVQYNAPAQPLACEDIEEPGYKAEIYEKSLLDRCDDIYSVFPSALYKQLNDIYKLELFLVWYSQTDYRLSHFFLNDNMCSSKIKTDDYVLKFRYDKYGDICSINKKARNAELVQYRKDTRIDGKYLKDFDKIEKFDESGSNNEDIFMALK